MQVKTNMTPNIKDKQGTQQDMSPATTKLLNNSSVIKPKGMNLNPISNHNVTNFDEAEKMTVYGEQHLLTKDLDQESNNDYIQNQNILSSQF